MLAVSNSNSLETMILIFRIVNNLIFARLPLQKWPYPYTNFDGFISLFVLAHRPVLAEAYAHVRLASWAVLITLIF